MNKKKKITLALITISIVIVVSIPLIYFCFKTNSSNPENAESFNIDSELLSKSVNVLTDEQKIKISRYFIVKELSLFKEDTDVSDKVAKEIFTNSYKDVGKHKLRRNIETDRFTDLEFNFSDEKLSNFSDEDFTYSGNVIIFGHNLNNNDEKTSMNLDYILNIVNENGVLKINKLTKNIIK
ncbi:hypothetical protein M3589_23950 [Heyndrickxia oleronia]|uniref:Lipoprotein n=1 Tax=Heyndrickxia oleronia TaxID=38875 RepID=A0AAW6SYY5_9BACI|nr:hypothetical protein [Heyndrickxia oleronia]MCM3240713.1 hypothetical protein [Heyndrickxia oleronia]MDH5163340.1 hypothetical protein [Heyndrickxia oleronia]NYV66523.1 hypothetical protein [Bacillus sp. Gen3]GIN41553.1 hypothetical protein J19TS1_45020 [Heyndrickxia oleronia]